MHILSSITDRVTQPSLTSHAARGASNGSTNGSTSGTGGTSGSGSSSVDQLTKESTFLNLLVAQIKNQDPLNPTDSIQFVGQLVQFSQLEQLLSINQGITKLSNGTPAAGTSKTSSGS
jgi:flagellar basal-body rod modification protein FlgD